MFNQSTDAVAQWGAGIPGFASSMATMTNGKFIMAAGGWPIRVGGVTVGGIGVSGGNAPGRDDEIARAGLAVIEAAFPPIPAQPPQQPLKAGASFPQATPQNQPTPYYSRPEPVATPAATPEVPPVDDAQPRGEVPSTQHLPDWEEPYNAGNYNPDHSGGKS